MLPPPPRRITGIAARALRKVPVMLTAIRRCQVSRPTVSAVPAAKIPAAQTSTSSRSPACAIIAATLAASATSTAQPSASPPAARIAATVSFVFLGEVGYEHPRTLAGKAQGHCPPDARTGASHYHPAALETPCAHPSSSPTSFHPRPYSGEDPPATFCLSTGKFWDQISIVG